GKNNGYRVVVLLRQGCPTTLEPIHGVGDICVAWTFEALQKIDEIQPEMVFTTSTRPLFQADPPQPGDYTPDGYVSFFAALQERGIDFFAIRDNPWALREDLDQFSPSVCEEAEEDCTIHRKTALNAENPAEEILANFPNGHSLDFSDIFCGPTTCRKVIGNIYVYRDSNHITDELAATFSPEMDRQIQKALRD
ncbi:SGNH hydrolase domain-containing protein, partial [Corynebacterium sp.]|uniref:SGNH hydrolase domain-containing protein n=1 Tax=Corynebacterium sp. TaxID=1720 RepID=UPI002904732D